MTDLLFNTKLTNASINPTPSQLLGPDGREWQNMPKNLWAAVERCDELLRRHGMQMTIYCESCAERFGIESSKVEGNNAKASPVRRLTCRHKNREYYE